MRPTCLFPGGTCINSDMVPAQGNYCVSDDAPTRGRITPVQTQSSLTKVCLITLQMLYVSNRSLVAHADWKSWQPYTELLQKDCPVLFVRINPLEGTRISAEEDAASPCTGTQPTLLHSVCDCWSSWCVALCAICCTTSFAS